MRRFVLLTLFVGLVVVALIWRQSWSNVDNFTTLSQPIAQRSSVVDLSGVYDIHQEYSSGDWGVETTPFSNQVLSVSQVEIKDVGDRLSIHDVASSELIGSFAWDQDIYKTDESTFEFFVDLEGNVPIFPGHARSRIEGQITKMDDGTLVVKKTFFEKGMLLYLIPFHDQHQWTFRLKPVDTKNNQNQSANENL